MMVTKRFFEVISMPTAPGCDTRPLVNPTTAADQKWPPARFEQNQTRRGCFGKDHVVLRA